MPKTPPNDGTELTHEELSVMRNIASYARLHNMPFISETSLDDGTKCTVVMHDDVKAWLDNTNEAYGIPVSFLVNAIIRHHMWLDVNTGEMRNDLSGMMWWSNDTEE